MNDGKKILAVVLGAIMGFGAVSVISRNFYKEEDEKPKVEQELPEDETNEPIAFKQGWVLKTDLAPEETVAYLEVTQGFMPESRSIFSINKTYEELCFKFKNVYSPTFQGYVYLRSVGMDAVVPENHSVLNLYVVEEKTCVSSGAVEVYYVPLSQEFLTAVENYNANDLATPLMWQQDENGNQYCTACLDGVKFGTKGFLDGTYEVEGPYIDPTSYFSGPNGQFTIYKLAE